MNKAKETAMKEELNGTSVETGDAADQCRELGIVFGETIVGREYSGGDNSRWHEARLTLLWFGESEAVFSVQERTDRMPRWSKSRESANWTLECRVWRKT